MEPLTDAVVLRIEASVAELAGRVRRAADLAALMRANAQPAAGLSAFVVFGGVEAAAPLPATGGHHQVVTRLVSVVTLLRAADPAAAGAADRAEALAGTLVAALAGWVPPGAMGAPMVYRRSRLVSAAAGTFAYEHDFAAQDLLRIAA